MNFVRRWRLPLTILGSYLFFLAVVMCAAVAFGAKPEPVHIVSEQYSLNPQRLGCIGEDGEVLWRAAGTLGAGESWTFTPRYPSCPTPRALFAKVTANGQLARNLVVTVDGHGSGQQGACAFREDRSDFYTVTVANVGRRSVELTLSGWDRNDWFTYFWTACSPWDGDSDGYSDALEHGAAKVTLDGVDGAVPPDYADGGVNFDAELRAANAGDGNGVPLDTLRFHEQYADDPLGPNGQTFPWRAWDHDGDGWV